MDDETFPEISVLGLEGNITDETIQSTRDKNAGKLVYVNEAQLMKFTAAQNLGLFSMNLVLVAVAVVANIVTLYISYRRKNRLFYKCCLMSLASSDLLAAVAYSIANFPKFFMPWTNYWAVGEFLCSFVPYMQTMAMVINSLTLCCIALDRYLGVVQALRGRWEPKMCACVISITSLWTIAAAIAVPSLDNYCYREAYAVTINTTSREIIGSPQYLEMCIVKSREVKSNYFIVVFSIVFVPLFIILVSLYSVIARYIWLRPKQLAGRAHISSPNTNSSRKTCYKKAGQKKNAQPRFIFSDTNSKKSTGHTTNLTTVASVCSTPPCNANQVGKPNGANLSSNQTNTLPPNSDVPRETTAASDSNCQSNARSERKARTFKIVIALIVAFILLRLPTWILAVINSHPSTVLKGRIWWFVSYGFAALGMLNSAINPFLYCFLNDVLRVAQRVNKWFHASACCCQVKLRGRNETCEYGADNALPNSGDRVEPAKVMVPRSPYFVQDCEQRSIPALHQTEVDSAGTYLRRQGVVTAPDKTN